MAAGTSYAASARTARTRCGSASVFDDSATVACAFCGEMNEIDVDLSAGRRQTYVEDCQVCCRPNLVRVRFDSEGRASVEAEPES